MENLAVNPAFWNGRRVFVTGHTGFKGGWLCLWLQALGAQVTGYALPAATEPALFNVAGVKRGMTSIEADIGDAQHLLQAIQQARPEIVIHLAAQALVRYSYQNPVETYRVNVMGLVNLFEAIRATPGIRAVVNVTSDKCYENKEWLWGYRENEPLGGYDPYSSSKACAELITSSYRNSYFNAVNYAEHGVALASARAGNVVGGGDWAQDRLIPDMLRAIKKNEAVRIRNPQSIRPWQHVLEPLSGYLMLAQRLTNDGLAFAESFNFGPDDNDAKPVGWLIERLCRQWGDGATWQLDDAGAPHEATYLKLDCSKAKSRLGWHARWNLEQTISNIVEWHQAHASGADMREMCLAQISRYQQREQ